MTGGRPLRFLALTLGGWATMRLALLWPEGERAVIAPTLGVAPALAAALPAEPLRPSAPPPPLVSLTAVASPPPASARLPSFLPIASPLIAFTGPTTPAPPAAMPALAMRTVEAPASRMMEPIPQAPLPPAPLVSGSSRLAGSAWALVRDGGGSDFAGGRLGAAQAGARFTYALGDARRVAVAARVSTPLAGRGREAAIGLDWRPTRLPVHLLAEQRVALDSAAAAGPALSLIGGLNPLPVAAGFRLEAYGQAGVTARAGRFADGAARLARPVAALGPARLELGVGAWGGAQRGAARLDVGPGAVLVVPLADRAVRLAFDWRQRVAGSAAPGSGPVLSIGQDF